MSDKVAAKEIAERSGVPMLGASKGAVRNIDDARETADKLGYPVIIKAVSGGGEEVCVLYVRKVNCRNYTS